MNLQVRMIVVKIKMKKDMEKIKALKIHVPKSKYIFIFVYIIYKECQIAEEYPNVLGKCFFFLWKSDNLI